MNQHPQEWADWWEKSPKTRAVQERSDKHPDYRTCKSCGERKPISEFHKSGIRGYATRCKPCVNESRRKPVEDHLRNVVSGEAHYCAKLSADDVRLIQALVDEREELLAKARRISNAALAEKFDVSKSTIGKIAVGAAWRSVA